MALGQHLHGSLSGFPSWPQDKPLQLLPTGRKQEQAVIKGLSPIIRQENHSQTSPSPPLQAFSQHILWDTRGWSWPRGGWELSICPLYPQQWERGFPTFPTRKKVNQGLPPYFTLFLLFLINQIYICFPKAHFR